MLAGFHRDSENQVFRPPQPILRQALISALSQRTSAMQNALSFYAFTTACGGAVGMSGDMQLIDYGSLECLQYLHDLSRGTLRVMRVAEEYK
eukprot:15447599-Heterocapsa_arctica.AAC.1